VHRSGIAPAPTVCAQVAAALARALHEAGVAATALDGAIAAGHTRVPARVVAEAWTAGEASSGDPMFGIHLAEGAAAGTFGPLELAARAAPTLGEALHELVARFAVVADGCELVLEDAEDVRIALSADGHVRHAVEFLFARIVSRSREIARASFAPKTVSFAHAAPRVRDDVEAFFRCPVVFAAARSEIVIARADLAIPFTTADALVRAVLASASEHLEVRTPLVQRVYAAASAALERGEASIGVVARAVGVSSRTLQRRLADDGTTFEALLDRLRRERALVLVLDASSSIDEIADAVGFAERSAFHRAFRRWTGTTPAAFRRAGASVHSIGVHGHGRVRRRAL
jgi:AraC-like DNA-binding protein